VNTSATKLHHLRQIVTGIESHILPAGVIGGQWLDGLRLFRARLNIHGHVVGIRKDAGLAVFNLTDLIFKVTARYARGVTFNDLLNQLSHLIIELFGDDPKKYINEFDLHKFEGALEQWFLQNSPSIRLYIPCKLTTVPGPSFRIGPISFDHVTDVIEREKKANEKLFEIGFQSVVSAMETEAAHWMANVDVSGCTKGRAWEIGDLAVDIAVTGLQLVIPLNFSERMARMTARNLPRNRDMVCSVDGVLSFGGTNQQPALGMGSGVLEAHLHAGRAVLEAVGHRVEAFLSGNTRPLSTLEQAWCDAAYWFHEGLAEPLDTIAVPKLETAIEVLLRTESTKGSKSRVLRAIKIFYGLNQQDFINPNVQITVEKFATDFVRDRSRILHGTWSTLAHSLRDSRPSLTLLVHGLLTNYVIELDAFAADPAAADDVDRFLDWVAARKAKASS
jgi:hypothetical protein